MEQRNNRRSLALPCTLVEELAKQQTEVDNLHTISIDRYGGDHSAVIVAADRLISRIDANELAVFYGTRHEEEDKSHDTKKMLLTALRHKAKYKLAQSE